MHHLNIDSEEPLAPTYAGRSFSHDIPKYRLPTEGVSADAAYQLVHDELNLDGNPTLNLASFVTSWMEPQADRLAAETLAKNLIDQDEYPQSEVIHQRVVSMIGRLFHAPAHQHADGHRDDRLLRGDHARDARAQAQLAAPPRGSGAAERPPEHGDGRRRAHLLGEVRALLRGQARVAPMEEGRYTIGAEQVEPLLDERTIAVAGLLGTTFTGQMDDLASIDALLVRVAAERGWSIPLHIDAASGGFIVPFARPQEEWDFRLPSVRSINVSNHKFGLVYPGMGTVIFRDQSDLPEELVFHINYLGGDMPNYSLNFSRPSSSVILQYFAFLRLGHSGYEQIVASMLANSRALASKLGAIDGLELITDGSAFPIVALRASDPAGTRSEASLPAPARSAAGSFPPTRSRPMPSTSRCCGWSSRRTSRVTWSTCSPTTSAGRCTRSRTARTARRARATARTAEAQSRWALRLRSRNSTPPTTISTTITIAPAM